MINPTRSNDSSINGTKRNVRELSTVDSRDDDNTTVLMKEEAAQQQHHNQQAEDESSCTMSLGDFSMTSLGECCCLLAFLVHTTYTYTYLVRVL